MKKALIWLMLLLALLCAALGEEPAIGPGASGERVSALLEKLADLGCLHLSLKGDHSTYLDKHQEAVMEAEARLGLSPDGLVTPEELEAILSAPVDPPTQPSRLQAGWTKGALTLTWKGARGAQFYRIYRADQGDSPVAVVSGQTVKWRDPTAEIGKDYTYALQACKYTVSAPKAEAVYAADERRRPGAVVVFGRFEQDEVYANGKEPLEWIVLEARGDAVMLITRYVIAGQPYHFKSAEVTWQSCSLRQWLNRDFLQAAFTPAEREALLTTAVDNSRAQGYPKWTASGGADTGDQIFLLSWAEAEKYFPGQADLRCAPTPMAVHQGAVARAGGHAWWWLRSPGDYAYRAARVTDTGTRFYSLVECDDIGVRPVLWAQVDAVSVR